MLNQYLAKLKQHMSQYYHQEETRQVFQKRMLSGVLSVLALLMAIINFAPKRSLYGA
jgi:uncharacterized BrkB/YihY/UPF0761 family membrane protein